MKRVYQKRGPAFHTVCGDDLNETDCDIDGWWCRTCKSYAHVDHLAFRVETYIDGVEVK